MKHLFLSLLLACGASFANAQDLFVENFNSTAIPAGWSQTSSASDGGWKFGTGNTSQYFQIPAPGSAYASTNDDGCNCNKSADRLISPAFDASSAAGQMLVVELDQFYGNRTYQSITESAKLQYSTDSGTTWVHLADLTANTEPGFQKKYVIASSIASFSDVQLSILYSDGGGWLFGYALNNLRVFIAPNVAVLKASSGSIGKYVDAIPRVIPTNSFLAGEMASGRMTVQSLGVVPITSFKIKTTYNGDSTTKLINGLTILPFESHTLTLDEWPVVSGNQTVTFEITEINGAPNTDLSYNSITQSITGVVPKPNKRVLAEEGTGTWCGWCPRGKVMMDWMYQNYSDHFVGIMVHNGDLMTNAVYDNGLDISVFPGCQIDRVASLKDSDPLEFYENMVAQVSKDPVAILTLSASVNGNTASITIDAEFTSNFLDGRLNVIIYENQVSGTGSTWSQANYYAGGGAGPMGGWENKPDPATGVKYDYTARALADGMKGAAGSLPASVSSGQIHSYTYNLPLNANWNVDNLYVVGILVKNSTGVVHNAFARKLSTIVNIDEIKALRHLQVFPNPASDVAFVELTLDQPEPVNIKVVNLTGQVLHTESLSASAGTQSVPLNTASLTAGSYLVQIQVGTEFVTRHLQIVR